MKPNSNERERGRGMGSRERGRAKSGEAKLPGVRRFARSARLRWKALGAVLGLAALGLVVWALGAGSSRAGQGDAAGTEPGGGVIELPRPQGDAVVRNRPDGGQYMDLRGHFYNYAVARVGAGGRIEQICTTDADAAEQFLQSGGSQAAPGSGAPSVPASVTPVGEEK